MRKLLTIIFSAALTLWLGGSIALFLFVQTMFRNDRAIAVNAAPMLFRVFESYQLVLLLIAMFSLIAWRLMVCSKAKKWIMALLIVAGICAVVQTAVVSNRMRAILAAGQSAEGEFRRLHGYSMMIYVSQTVVLAAAACLLPAAISAEADWKPRTSPKTQPA